MGNTLIRYHPPGLTWRQSEEPGLDALYWELIGLGYCQKVSRETCIDKFFGHMERGWQEAVAGRRNLRAADWLKAGLKDLRVPPSVAPLEELTAIYAAPLRSQVEARIGAAEALATLREQGVRVGLISNTFMPGRFHEADLASLGLRPYLEHLTFSGDAGVWKPHTEIFQATAEALGVAPAEAVFVGDSPREDILGAKAAGMRAVWAESLEFGLDGVVPDGQVADLRELLPMIARWA